MDDVIKHLEKLYKKDEERHKKEEEGGDWGEDHASEHLLDSGYCRGYGFTHTEIQEAFDEMMSSFADEMSSEDDGESTEE